ncbi:MAG TPA: TetR/AcrR family transcriptional regulator [Bacillota bacterium]|nr:TetR/AcrR family transcriptional regulator [Bacillota bacterium]
MAINASFLKLKEEKKELIIHAAMNEFIRNGFENASTNEIVKNANISKGSLFNYFNSKKDLYIYLFDYGIGVIETFYQMIDLQETDVFKRIENIGVQKMYIQKKYPLVFDFLASTNKEDSPEVKDLIKDKRESVYKRGLEIMYQNIDYSKFRDDIDIEKAMEILNWTMFGFSDKAIEQIDTFADSEKLGERFIQEWKQYAKILKYSFYK